MVAHAKTRYISPDEYIRREIDAETKSEYVNGVIIAMSGSSANHSAITFNMAGAIRPKLSSSGCRGFSADLRIRIDLTNCYYYPDMAIVCGEPKYETLRGMQHLLNPSVVFEVLSNSTEQRDRGEKWLAYRQIDSLTTYVLVHQDRPMVELHERELNSGRWVLTVFEGPDATFKLAAIKDEIALADIYEDIVFEPRVTR